MITPTPCIWCKSTSFKPSLEHILPEALDCPPGFWLIDCVCEDCNSRVSRADRVLIRQFEIFTFIHGIRRKKGKRPSIDGWSSVKGSWNDGNPKLHINAGPEDIVAEGKKLIAARKSNGIYDVSQSVEGNVAKITFKQEFGNDPGVSRGLHKIALETIAYFHGAAYAVDPMFDPLREFVLNRKSNGTFRFIMTAPEDEPVHRFARPVSHPDSPYPVVGMSIFGVGFLVDTSPNQENLAILENKLKSTDEFGPHSVLPLTKKAA